MPRSSFRAPSTTHAQPVVNTSPLSGFGMSNNPPESSSYWGTTNPSAFSELTSSRDVPASLLHARSATSAQQSNAASTTPTSPGWPDMFGSAVSSTGMEAQHHPVTNASAASPSNAGTNSSPTTPALPAQRRGGRRMRSAASLASVVRHFRACHPFENIANWSTRKLDDRGSRRYSRDRSGSRPLLAFTLTAGDVGGKCRSFHGPSCWQGSGLVGFLALLRRRRCHICRSVDGASHMQRMMAVPGCCCRLAEHKLYACLTPALSPVKALKGSINIRHGPVFYRSFASSFGKRWMLVHFHPPIHRAMFRMPRMGGSLWAGPSDGLLSVCLVVDA